MDKLFPLRRVEVQDFRGVRTLSLVLEADVTVLFGTNASGKTTILDALAIGLGPIVDRLPGVGGRKFAKRGDIRQPSTTQLQYDEQANSERPFAHICMVGHADGLTWDVVKMRTKADSPPQERMGLVALHGVLDPVIKGAANLEPDAILPVVAFYGNERAVVDVPVRERGFAKEMSRFEALRDALNASTKYKEVFEWFRLMQEEENTLIREREDLNYRLPALEWVRRAVERAELGCTSPRLAVAPPRLIVDFQRVEDALPEELELTQLSDGYRTHFALVLDLARRMVQANPSDDLDDPSRGTNSYAVVLIDEIDLHLHPEWQGRVLGGLLKAFPNAQFVVSTHSEQVLASVRSEKLRRLDMRDGAICVDADVAFSQGATSDRILELIMGVPRRVDGEITKALYEYLCLVELGETHTARAVELRALLDDALPGDPALDSVDRASRRQSFLQRFAGAGE